MFDMRRRVYALEVMLTEGMVEDDFCEENPIISRTIEIPGHQTLEQLHRAIFKAFDREEEHLYEFQLSDAAIFPEKRYVPAEIQEEEEEECGITEDTTIQELKLQKGDVMLYLFDYDDIWAHQITVQEIQELDDTIRYPRITKKVGQRPPQYAEW
jgi:hypothetical protein